MNKEKNLHFSHVQHMRRDQVEEHWVDEFYDIFRHQLENDIGTYRLHVCVLTSRSNVYFSFYSNGFLLH